MSVSSFASLRPLRVFASPLRLCVHTPKKIRAEKISALIKMLAVIVLKKLTESAVFHRNVRFCCHALSLLKNVLPCVPESGVNQP